ncbi:hypothetical protein Syun_002069 [Stephania yunnanensis]|uniref:YbaK/aminoacyl-tRNA synthetase-associated domain-containing protein n=1 Tax=Stephania yunnanensis TaxID=152371 RepID=A0AAP0Q8F3_9MAGN
MIVVVEGINRISRSLVSLSKQELVDCDKKKNEGNLGMRGIWEFGMRVDMYRMATEWVGAQFRCPKWELNIKFDRYDHPVVLTVEAQVKYVGHIGGGLSKNLFLKDKKQRFYIVSALADTTIDMKGFRIDVHALKPDFN